MTHDPFSEPLVTIARIRRFWGNRGEVIADLHTDFPERFESVTDVWLRNACGETRRERIESFRFHKGGVVLKFAGLDDIGSAEVLAGFEIVVPASERVPLQQPAVYQSELAGCIVIEQGREIGIVRHLDPAVGTPVLVVDTPEGELLVPFAEDICRRVDLKARCIEVSLPEGLRELNR